METLQQRAENFRKFGKWDGNLLHTIFWDESIRELIENLKAKKALISDCEMQLVNTIQHEWDIRQKKGFEPSNITAAMWKITCCYEEVIDRARQIHSFLRNAVAHTGLEQIVSDFPDFSITPAIWHQEMVFGKKPQDKVPCTSEVMKLREYVAPYGTLFQELDAVICYLYREDFRLYRQQTTGIPQEPEDIQLRQANFKAAGRWDGSWASLTFWEKREKKLLVLLNGGIGIIRIDCDLYFMTALYEENQIRAKLSPEDRTITPAMWRIYYSYEEVVEKIKQAIEYIDPLAKIEKIPELVPQAPDLSISPAFWFEQQVPYAGNEKLKLAPSIAKLYQFICRDGVLEEVYNYLSFYAYLNDMERYQNAQK